MSDKRERETGRNGIMIFIAINNSNNKWSIERDRRDYLSICPPTIPAKATNALNLG